MTREETKTILATLATTYPKNLMPEITDLTVNVWFQLLQDIPYPIVQAATAAWLASNRYPPTIADIRETALVKSLESAIDTAEEAWGKVQIAVRRYGWTEEERAKAALGDLIWKTVGSFGWKYWCQMPIDEESTYFAQFRNAYNVAKKRTSEMVQIPAQIREKLSWMDHGENKPMIEAKPQLRLPQPDDSPLTEEQLAFKRMILGEDFG